MKLNWFKVFKQKLFKCEYTSPINIMCFSERFAKSTVMSSLMLRHMFELRFVIATDAFNGSSVSSFFKLWGWANFCYQ